MDSEPWRARTRPHFAADPFHAPRSDGLTTAKWNITAGINLPSTDNRYSLRPAWSVMQRGHNRSAAEMASLTESIYLRETASSHAAESVGVETRSKARGAQRADDAPDGRANSKFAWAKLQITFKLQRSNSTKENTATTQRPPRKEHDTFSTERQRLVLERSSQSRNPCPNGSAGGRWLPDEATPTE